MSDAQPELGWPAKKPFDAKEELTLIKSEVTFMRNAIMRELQNHASLLTAIQQQLEGIATGRKGKPQPSDEENRELQSGLDVSLRLVAAQRADDLRDDNITKGDFIRAIRLKDAALADKMGASHSKGWDFIRDELVKRGELEAIGNPKSSRYRILPEPTA